MGPFFTQREATFITFVFMVGVVAIILGLGAVVWACVDVIAPKILPLVNALNP